MIESNLVPVFGEIEDIIIDKEHSYYIVCNILETCQFISHFHAYEVSLPVPPTYHICKPSDLFDHNVLSKYSVSSVQYIPLKYHLIEHI